jgi:hypothetical protein
VEEGSDNEGAGAIETVARSRCQLPPSQCETRCFLFIYLQRYIILQVSATFMASDY